MEKDKYITLLETILKNANRFKDSAAVILKSLPTENDYRNLSSAQFLLYCAMEECGKFLIVKDLYPKKIDSSSLRSNGFYRHEPKINRVLRNFEIDTKELNIENIKKKRELFKIILKYRSKSLYVDYSDVDGVIDVEEDRHLIEVCNVVKFVILLCQDKFNRFKINPLL